MADQELQKAGAQALLALPAYLKRGIDPSKLEVVQGPPEKAYDGHDAMASIDPGNHNRIIVHDRDAFLADPNATAQAVGHELSHAIMDTNPAIYKPIPEHNPYDVDLNNLQNKKLSDLNQEQIATVVQHDIAARMQPGLTPQRRQQLIDQYAPITNQVANIKPGTIQTDQTGQVDNPTKSPLNLLNPGTMNTQPNAPAGQDPNAPNAPKFDALPTQVAPASGPVSVQTAPGGSQGSFTDDDIVQPAFTDDDILTPSQTVQQENKQNLRSGLVGAAKGVGDALLSTSPLGTGISMIPAVQRTLAANGPQEVAGKVASAGAMAALTPAVAEEEASTQLGNVAQKLKQGYSDAHVTDAMHGDIHAALGRYAAKVGIDYDPQQPIRNAIPQIINGITKKAQVLQDKVANVFSGLVGDTGDVEQLGMEGDYNKLKQNVVTAQKKVDSTIGGGKLAAHEAAKTGLSQAEADMALANHMLDEQGLKGAREQADALFKQAEDLKKINKSLNKNTTGLKAEGVNTTPERVNGQKLTPELEQHYANGTLQNAFDEQTSHDLLNASAQGGRMQRSVLRNKIVTGAAVPAALGAMGVGHSMVKGAAEAAIGAIP